MIKVIIVITLLTVMAGCNDLVINNSSNVVIVREGVR